MSKKPEDSRFSLKNIKISIRLSIITLFILLLSFVGLTIININYWTLTNILSKSAKHYIEQTSMLLQQRLNFYFLPLSQDLLEIRNMIHRGIIDLNDEGQFSQYLFESINHNPDIFMVYYGTEKGDFIGVDRENPRTISLNKIFNSKTPTLKTRYELDAIGVPTKSAPFTKPYDPRVRPWYKAAIEAGRPIWTVYKFFVFGKGDILIPGITSAAPIYDKQGKLQGVIALDMTLDNLQHFIKQLLITPNSVIYITDDKMNVIAYQDPDVLKDIRGEKLSSQLTDLFQSMFPAKGKKHLQASIKSYVKDGVQYFLAYQPIEYKNIQEHWHVMIIVPAEDILAPLKRTSWRALILTLVVLLIGIIIVRYISQKISQPIIQLAEEANEITRLNLEPREPLDTIIKEISYMDRTLMRMRSSLLSFQRYVPGSLVRQLIYRGKIAQVGGEKQTITIMFSDIKDFTKISEKTTPERLMTYLSDYFQSMTEAVIAKHGTLDKYIGDAVMAFWNAPLADPLHAMHACQTAMAMIARVKKLNQKNQNTDYPAISIRIGINTGEAVVGNVGSEDRLSYTAIGDTINLASRLEAANKKYHTQIIVTHATVSQIEEYFPFRILDEVAVRGKEESTIIYELVTAEDTTNLDKHKQEFAEAFANYQKGNWKKSLQLFRQLTPAYPGDKLSEVYISRCEALLKTSPGEWDGIFHMSDADL
ncbi:adenylate/guanylate cyclase domain-containing protein [Legionella septentrionalis]|uniref:adenylate/guanylate cyclase domain-containing protein n=1 Tax=Legionella septentrionalis TaxID=2498109 RepID=UPI001F2C3E8D|nr:adenylate/guanylate cyclase domain-containing protein [Legionella septentrionalis]